LSEIPELALVSNAHRKELGFKSPQICLLWQTKQMKLVCLFPLTFSFLVPFLSFSFFLFFLSFFFYLDLFQFLVFDTLVTLFLFFSFLFFSFLAPVLSFLFFSVIL